MKLFVVPLSLIFILVLSSCNVMDSNMHANEMFFTFPSNGAVEVNLNEEIKIVFAKSIDRKVAEENFFLYQSGVTADSICTFGASHNHEHMMQNMNHSMSQHLNDMHSVPGTFSWQNNGSELSFKPHTMLLPGMQYMIHLKSDMMNMMSNNMMGSHMQNIQMRGMSDMMGGMMIHFTTINLEK